MQKITILLTSLCLLCLAHGNLHSQCNDLYIEGFIDGPLSGGTPKAIQLCATANIPDLSVFGIESVTNAGTSAGIPEFNLAPDALAMGECIWITKDATEFFDFFGFDACYVEAQINGNGDDDYLLYCSGTLIDVHGVDGQDESGQAWDYLDGWANRNGSTANSTFDNTEWTYSGINALDGESTNATAATPYPDIRVNCAPVIETILISEVELCTQTIELQNVGSTTVDISAWRLCSRPIYHAIGSANVTLVSGSLMVAPGDFVVLQWPSITTTGAGEIGLYLPTGGFGAAASIVDYVVYNGIPASNRASVAVAAGVWDDVTLSATFDAAAGCATAIAEGTLPSLTNSTTWCTADSPTLGAANSACVSNIVCAAVGDLVITEILSDPNPPEDSSDEFFEVYNPTGSDIDMLDYVIKDAGANSFTISTSLIVPAGGYVVFGENGDPLTNGGVAVDYVYPSATSLSNTEDEIIIECGGTVIDQVFYDSGWPGSGNGTSISLSPSALDAISNDDPANWCDATSMTGDFVASLGSANDMCPIATCMIDLDFISNLRCENGDFLFDVNFTASMTSGTVEVYDLTNSIQLATGPEAISPITITLPMNNAVSSIDIVVRDVADASCTSAARTVETIDCSAVVCANTGDLVISEILYNPSPPEGASDEFFEVHNPTGNDIDMFGYTVTDNGGNNFLITTSLIVPAGGYAVFGENADMATNGGVVTDYEYPGFNSLANDDDEIIITCNTTVIDQVVYDTNNGWPDPGGGFSISLDPGSLDATLNDDPANWCAATSTTGVFVASLGSANDACAPSCPNDLVLSGNLDVTTDYEADMTIISTEIIGMTDPNIMVDYDAGVEITMDPIFEVVLGVEFHAFIDGCGGSQ